MLEPKRQGYVLAAGCIGLAGLVQGQVIGVGNLTPIRQFP